MKLLNYTLFLLSLALFAILSLWSILFYFQMLNRVKATIDDGLANYKILIIDQVKDDTLIVQQKDFFARNYIIREVSSDYALQVRDSYKDTLVYSSIRNIYEPTRLLTTAFAKDDGRYYEMKVISPVLDKSDLIREVVRSLIWLYLALLISHTVLAAVVPVLCVITLYRAARKQFDRHRRVARVTLPIWLYVSVTGVLIYVVLYRIYPGTSSD